MKASHAVAGLWLFSILFVTACGDSDLCPDDPAKTQAGACGCGVSDADANGNGVPDCFDSAIDLCPADAAKTTPGT